MEDSKALEKSITPSNKPLLFLIFEEEGKKLRTTLKKVGKVIEFENLKTFKKEIPTLVDGFSPYRGPELRILGKVSPSELSFFEEFFDFYAPELVYLWGPEPLFLEKKLK